MLGVTQHQDGSPAVLVGTEDSYEVYFGLGQEFRLLDRPGVFKVSQAGLALGDYLVRSAEVEELRGAVLDMGTGSGALALLLRGLGADDILATDVSPEAVATAGENEQLNFHSRQIAFEQASLFGSAAAGARFDLIVFNPPGWRTPSPECRRELEHNRLEDLGLSAMFSGETVLLEFLQELPHRLTPAGRAVVGLNSLSGIRDVLARSQTQLAHRGALRLRLVERHSFPLFLYTDDWRMSRDVLVKEFQRWREAHGAVFTLGPDGTLNWSYEIVELHLSSACRGIQK